MLLIAVDAEGSIEPIPNSLYLASLQEPSAFEYRGYRLFDSRLPRRRLLGRGKVVQGSGRTPGRREATRSPET
jgi:hypothetical protein